MTVILYNVPVTYVDKPCLYVRCLRHWMQSLFCQDQLKCSRCSNIISLHAVSVLSLRCMLQLTRRITLCLDGWSMINLSASYLGICVCFYDLISAKIRNFVLQLSQVQHPVQQLYSCGVRTIWNTVSSSGKYSLIGCGWQWKRFHSLTYPDGELGGSNPPNESPKPFNCEFAKYTPTVQALLALLLYSLNPLYRNTLKWYTNFTFCFSFWRT